MQVQPQDTTNLHTTSGTIETSNHSKKNQKKLAVNNNKHTKQHVVNRMTSSSTVAADTLFYAKPTSPYR